ncbi:Alpha/Beta hydrolase protein [Endogone sp. FLAS-F59071]|nr:Alpha/Beta hydrolase protein [Endogone sp. FLAS-F59071]|eukprot:RUS20035.1 Alpha/Beta hydrolase protein [Endogone sp. FLAS-F59071]
MALLSIPILDRISMRDYQSLILTLLFFMFEGFIRVIVMLLPTVIIEEIESLIKWTFPWLFKHESKPHVSPLERAESFQKMVKFWYGEGFLCVCVVNFYANVLMTPISYTHIYHSRGYPLEQHIVKTQDGYLLTVFRIPRGRHEESPFVPSNPSFPANDSTTAPIFTSTTSPSTTTVNNLANFLRTHKASSSSLSTHFGTAKYSGKPVVLLYHGFMMCSEVWVCHLEEQSNLPFLLADLGYDVWLGNSRGNKYSQRHVKRSAQEQRFWEFSLDEFAMYDMPDTINFILETTGAPNLTYIGFSQGTAQGFASLSIHPKLNDKVNLFIALAPATTPKGLHSPLIDAFVKATPSVIYLFFGRKSPLKMALFWQRVIAPSLFVRVIDASVNFLFGWRCKNMSEPQKLVSYQHLYSLTSVKTLVHWFQIIRTGTFQMYDDQPSRWPYPTDTTSASHATHRFPTLQIRTPMAIFYGGSDSLVEFEVLSADLPELAFVKEIKKWEHLDFLWGRDIEKLVWPDVLHLLSTFNPGAKPALGPVTAPLTKAESRNRGSVVDEAKNQIFTANRAEGERRPKVGNGKEETEERGSESTGTSTEEEWVVETA